MEDRVKNEIQLHQNLHHNNVVGMIESFEDDESVYIVLELCEGGDLRTFLRHHGRVSERVACKLFVQLIQAVVYLHNHECILHRDLKLSNLLLSDSLQLKVADFGLAVRIVDPVEPQFTVCGTPNFIAPEILHHESSGHTFPVDIWSCGCVLYTLVVGKAPFQGSKVSETLQNVIKQRPVEFPSFISDSVKDLIKKLLQPDPKQRIVPLDILQHGWIMSNSTPNTTIESTPHSQLRISSENCPSRVERAELSSTKPEKEHAKSAIQEKVQNSTRRNENVQSSSDSSPNESEITMPKPVSLKRKTKRRISTRRMLDFPSTIRRLQEERKSKGSNLKGKRSVSDCVVRKKDRSPLPDKSFESISSISCCSSFSSFHRADRKSSIEDQCKKRSVPTIKTVDGYVVAAQVTLANSDTTHEKTLVNELFGDRIVVEIRFIPDSNCAFSPFSQDQLRVSSSWSLVDKLGTCDLQASTFLLYNSSSSRLVCQYHMKTGKFSYSKTNGTEEKSEAITVNTCDLQFPPPNGREEIQHHPQLIAMVFMTQKLASLSLQLFQKEFFQLSFAASKARPLNDRTTSLPVEIERSVSFSTLLDKSNPFSDVVSLGQDDEPDVAAEKTNTKSSWVDCDDPNHHPNIKSWPSDQDDVSTISDTKSNHESKARIEPNDELIQVNENGTQLKWDSVGRAWVEEDEVGAANICANPNSVKMEFFDGSFMSIDGNGQYFDYLSQSHEFKRFNLFEDDGGGSLEGIKVEGGVPKDLSWKLERLVVALDKFLQYTDGDSVQ